MMIELVDTHCHIHFPDYKLDPEQVIADGALAGVRQFLCVGCTYEDSAGAVDFVRGRENAWASIGLHPHEAHHYVSNAEALDKFAHLATQEGVVAVGECGLDYYYNHSPKEAQVTLLKFQFELAAQHNLPMIFHVRDAFDDFWPIFDQYAGVRGVVHSFSATEKELRQALERGLYIGLNGIMTFTKREDQLAAAKTVPLDRLVLETDAPFLTPAPYRGKICQLQHVRVTAEFLAELRGEPLETLARATTHNARMLFDLV